MDIKPDIKQCQLLGLEAGYDLAQQKLQGSEASPEKPLGKKV